MFFLDVLMRVSGHIFRTKYRHVGVWASFFPLSLLMRAMATHVVTRNVAWVKA